jgi:hypothetical protein
MSWLYWLPKSSTTTVSKAAAVPGSPALADLPNMLISVESAGRSVGTVGFATAGMFTSSSFVIDPILIPDRLA